MPLSGEAGVSEVSLEPAEIVRLTGKVQPAAQIRHLRRMGIKAERSDNPEQPVCVLRAWLPDKNAEAVESRQKPLQRWEKRGASA